MKGLLLLVIWLCGMGQPKWETDFSVARKQAAEQHKFILLNFSGSDWCAPCIQMRKEILEHPEFIAWANSHVILVNADFPREKKHQLPKNLQQQNEKLADQYNAKGVFPLTLLLKEDGSVKKSWEGHPKMSAEKFVQQLNSFIQ
jgi:thioredoxin-related protein